MGQECPFSVAPQGEVNNEYNPGFANLHPPKNNIRFYPAKRPPTGPTGAIPENQNQSPIQEKVYPSLIKKALSSPELNPNFGPVNKQSRSDLLSSSESCNGQGTACLYSEPLLIPSPCPEPPITPYTPQNAGQFEAPPQGPFQLEPFSLSPLRFTNPDRSVQTQVNDVECPQQDPSFSSNNAFTSLSVPMLRKFFTPLVPYPNSRLPLPCADIQPSPLPQGPSVLVEPLNNQGCLANSPVDVFPLQQCPREQDNPMINNNYPPLNLEPEQILPSQLLSPSVNCLPPSPAIEPYTLPESQLSSSIPPCPSSIDPFHDPSSLSTCDQCKVTRSLCSCPVSSCQSCQPTCPRTVCDDEPSLFQIETCLQAPHNIPSCICNENCSPHSPYCEIRPSLSLNSGCCSCSNNEFFMPQPCCNSQSCCTTQSCGTPHYCIVPSPPQFSCDCSPPCSPCAMPSSTPVCLSSCESPCHSPEPINVQINVPPPIIPAPSITIINTAPEPAPTSIDSGYYDMSPIIIDSRRRRSKSWLPLLLVWLFSCDGFGGF